jgi:hypothetical protein
MLLLLKDSFIETPNIDCRNVLQFDKPRRTLLTMLQTRDQFEKNHDLRSFAYPQPIDGLPRVSPKHSLRDS